jgi:hypothetical protein
MAKMSDFACLGTVQSNLQKLVSKKHVLKKNCKTTFSKKGRAAEAEEDKW